MTTTRVPQEERSRVTRQRLLDATVGCLLERGYTGTTTTLVSERAGVSRGAQLHHFPSKVDLVLAAVRYVSDQRRAQLLAAAAAVPAGPGRTRAIVEMLGDHVTSPVFPAALELWVAARTDPELRREVGALEQELGRETHRTTVTLLDVDERRAGVRELVQATLDLMRGLGLADTLSDDTERRSRVLARWTDVLERELADA